MPDVSLVPKFAKHPLFADFGRKKNPFATEIADLRPNKTLLFKQKAIFFHNISYGTLLVKVRIYVTASNWRHYSMYVVFFITSKLWLKLKYIYA